MLDNPYTYIGAIVVILAAIMACVVYLAPLGHQDESGFHIDGDEK